MTSPFHGQIALVTGANDPEGLGFGIAKELIDDGATDELGREAVEDKAHVRDFHVTLLRLLGLDDNKLTYYHAGRFKQLSQFGGTAIKKLIA